MGMDMRVLKGYLNHGFIYVEFEKRDGTMRKMWCTRDNLIVEQTGHESIQFTHDDAKRQERGGILFVYDIQEKDVRRLNSKTVVVDSLKHYDHLHDVEIPSIKTRFEIEAERALNVDRGLVESTLGSATNVDLKTSGTGHFDLAGSEVAAGREKSVTLEDRDLLDVGFDLEREARENKSALRADASGVDAMGDGVGSISDAAITEVVPVKDEKRVVKSELETKRLEADRFMGLDDIEVDDFLL